MAYGLNNVWPKDGRYIGAGDDLLVTIGGPAFTLLLSLAFLLVIEKYKTRAAYPFVLFQFVFRFLSLVVGGFGVQDEARISAISGTLESISYRGNTSNTLILFLMVLRASRLLADQFEGNSYHIYQWLLCVMFWSSGQANYFRNGMGGEIFCQYSPHFPFTRICFILYARKPPLCLPGEENETPRRPAHP